MRQNGWLYGYLVHIVAPKVLVVVITMTYVEPWLMACGVALQFGYHGCWQTAFQHSWSSIIRYQR